MEEKKELKVNPALLQFTYRKLIDSCSVTKISLWRT